MIPESYEKWAEIYKLFAEKEYDNLDFSNKSLEESFLFETYGKGNLKTDVFSREHNGFIVGKKLMDITIENWNKDEKIGLWNITEISDLFPMWFKYKIYKILHNVSPEKLVDELLNYPNCLRVWYYNINAKWSIEKLGYSFEKYIKSMENNCKKYKITLNENMEFCEIKGDR